MTCGVCKAEMREGASRCRGCGAKPGEAPPPENASSGRQKAAYPRPTRPGATVWQVTTDAPHTIELELSMWTGRETITLDGRQLASATKWGLSSEHRVPLGAETGVLTIATGLGGVTATLKVGGAVVAPVSTATFVHGGGSTPAWSYGFAAACFAIPLVTLGGAIPGALGFGAGAACMAIAKEQKWPLGQRVVLCGVVTVGAWGLLGALVMAVAGSR